MTNFIFLIRKLNNFLPRQTTMPVNGMNEEEESNLLSHLVSEFGRPLGFSYLKGRMEEQTENLPWDYESAVKSLLPDCSSLLDMGVGEGEFLASLSPLPEDTCATEGWPPNIDIARKRLKPLGVTVTAITDNDVRLPLDDNRFDLIINRHEPYIAYEVNRLLRQGGLFITQQIGEKDNTELNRLLGAPEHPGYREWHCEQACTELAAAGLTIIEKREALIETRFYDVGAIVYYLKANPWQVEDFSVEKYADQLINLHHIIQKEGYLPVKSHRFFIIARC